MGVLDVYGIKRHGSTAQLWNVEAFQAVVVEAWLLLWQEEWAMSLALAVDVAEVRPTVEPVVALAEEDKPTTVVRPTVIGVALVAVDYL